MLPFLACSIHIIGDWGRRGQFSQIEVAERMETMHYDAVISTGDNFYPDGISHASDWQVYESWYDIYEPSVPWYVALGNHDHRGNVQAQTEIDVLHWNMPSSVYKFELCGHVFIVMDSTVVNQEQWEVVDKLLTETEFSNKWIVAHHPIFSAGWHHDVPQQYRDNMTDIYKKHNVNGIISGHDHDLQYIEVDGIRQIISGAGSSTYYTQSPQNGLKFFKATPGFVNMVIMANSVHFRYFEADQDEILFETILNTD